MKNPDSLLAQAIRAALDAGRAILDVYSHPSADWQVEQKADHSPLTLADRRSHEVIARQLADTSCPILSEEGIHLPYEERKAWTRCWIVDPLDGTKEFIKRNGEFTVNIALVENGKPVMGVVYAPTLGKLYYGAAGQGSFVCKVAPDTGHTEAPQALTPSSPAEAAEGKRPLRIVASRSHLNESTQAFIDRLSREYGEVQLVSAGSSLKLCLVAEGKADFYPRLAPTMEWDTAAGQAVAEFAGCSVTDAATEQPLRYNKEDLHNPFFVVRPARA